MILLDIDKKPIKVSPEEFQVLCEAWTTGLPSFTVNKTLHYRVIKDGSITIIADIPSERYMAFERAHRQWEYELYRTKTNWQSAKQQALTSKRQDHEKLALETQAIYESHVLAEPTHPKAEGFTHVFALDPELTIPKHK